MHRYRSHTCGALRESDIGEVVRLSGWCHRIRDHGGVLFIDLRDHYGMTQCVVDPDSPAFKPPRRCARNGWCGSTARCASAPPAPRTRTCRPARSRSTSARSRCWAPAAELPMPVFGDQEYPEETRLDYRFLDLRREKLHRNIMTRGAIIDTLRRRMKEQRLLRVPDPDPDRVVARRRARLPGAVAAASGQVLRAAAGAAAVQAAHHGGGLRPLFPDRALLPRRGSRAPTARPASSTSSTSR